MPGPKDAVPPPSERRLNHLLRLIDWRFLLSSDDPPRRVAVGSGTGLDEALATLGAELGHPSARPPGEADLAVGRGAAELAALRAMLAPGGTCVSAWALPILGGHRVLTRRLAAAGFDAISCYWAWPAPARGDPGFWLPLGSAAATDYVLAHQPGETHGLERALRRGRTGAWRLQARLGMLAPTTVIARAGRDAPAVGGGLSGIASTLGADRDAERVCWLLLTRGRRSINKVVALGFDGGQRRPVVAVKIARRAESDAALEREADSLRGLARTADGAPRVLGLHRVGGRVALAETFVDGSPLMSDLRDSSFARLGHAAAAWLAELVVPGASDGREERLVIAPFRQFSRAYASVADAGELRATEAQLAGLRGLPVAFEHRDFAPWNLARAADGRLVAYDWESSEPDGLPLVDLVYFLAFAAFVVDGSLESGRLEQSYEGLVGERGERGAAMAAAIEWYRQRIGLAPELVGPLRLLTWIIHANVELTRLAADAAGELRAETLRAGVFFRLWRLELRCSGSAS